MILSLVIWLIVSIHCIHWFSYQLLRIDYQYLILNWLHFTFFRCAPESLAHRKFSEKSDVWSFGVTLWEIFSFGDMPSIGKIEELVIDLHQGKRLKRPKDCPLSIYQVMLFSCWQYYAHERLTFAEILDKLQSIERTMSVSQNNDNSDCWSRRV